MYIYCANEPFTIKITYYSLSLPIAKRRLCAANMRKRSVILYMVITLSFMALTLRIIEINSRLYSEASQSQQTKTITIGTSRGKIYDRNLQLLTDCESKLIAAVTPSNTVLQFGGFVDDAESIEQRLKSAKPFAAEVKTEINNELIRTFAVPIRYTDSCACHLVGYLDQSGTNGLAGIEKAYNSYLKENSGSLTVSFEVDAYGRALAGLDKTINDNNFSSKAGIVLTIDKDIQNITENALSESRIVSGCALVMHIDSGEIYAMASVPTYDRNNVQASLAAENSPLVNKALQSYSVGSVFKPIVAAAALENGISENTEFECTGSITLGDTVFKCYDEKVHGKETMKEALENSCNTYFINLMEKIDTDYLLSLCRSLGFENETQIADGIFASKGLLPENSDLNLIGERANFSFGQGKLLASPFQILAAYHALATGNYVKPTVIRGTANENALMKTVPSGQANKIFSDSTVLKIRSMLSSVVENGNAKKAKSSLMLLAGKTGTAQSGIYKDGKEITRTWFAGFYPANNPHYIVVILNENGASGSSDCAPVFRTICEGIALETN